MKVKRLIELKPVSIKNPCITGELQARDHCFVRYGDDCSIYVKSEKSAQRVMETVTDYIETKLKLTHCTKVYNKNKEKDEGANEA